MACVRFVFWGLIFFGEDVFFSRDFYGVFFVGVAISSFFWEFTIIGISYLFSFCYYFLLAVPGKLVLLFILFMLFLYYFYKFALLLSPVFLLLILFILFLYYFYKFVWLLSSISPVFLLFSFILLIWFRLELLPMALFLAGSSFDYLCVLGLLTF